MAEGRADGGGGRLVDRSADGEDDVGVLVDQALRDLAPDASDDQRAIVVEGYKTAFRTARMEGRLHEPLFDGMGDLLRRLYGRGITLGVATGKSDRGLSSCLKTHGIADLFVTLQTADRHPSKPDPTMLEAALSEAGATADQAVMVGDTSFDMEMARAAGVRAIGVSWGYHAPAELLEYGACGVADTMAELEALIDG